MPPHAQVDPLRLDPEGLYARLGVSPSAAADEIRAAFRQRARILHPDVPGTGDADAFVAARQAYDTLHDLHRRAAYDRSARLAARGADAGGIARHAPATVQTPRLRHPRLSDLPAGLWVGAAVVVCIGLAQAAMHLFSGPAQQSRSTTVIVPRGITSAGTTLPGTTTPGTTLPGSMPAGSTPAGSTAATTTAAPSTAARPAPTSPAAPIQLLGTPNYYTVPAAGPTILWHRQPDRPELRPGQQLPPFSTVQGLRLQNGLVEVLVNSSETGLVEATRLAPGDASAARRAYCAYNAGSVPADGEILTRRAAGSNALEVSNRGAQPLVLKLRDTLGALAVSVYLGPRARTTVIGLPRGPYVPEFAIGELWSRTCNSFAAGMRAQQFTTPLPLPALSPLSLPPDAENARDIADAQFEAD